ncbi:FAD-dependent monooxygenase [Komagataeibacter intermedius]|uniref:FAD-dependent oxidoreductase n=2 Tax=Komagataeibacter intermedius TaxID=66229 RepID=A0A0N1FBP3_9PROT|nr:FAD-dependent monooxygenase [Komagataeibacter intermedius]KPH87438.1 FAD-dependent oxidoreductase [Komagataeibacter intermedius AF2]MCF3636157.1 FAD-dependent monooxygenase [Komagataeibacter intermedius]GAN87856.1 oxidoreductase [Komagataeibacter intermedius TF2]GBQ63864.1 oxidoreductase [Komagataeibacter intermedius NRIC 0521]
MIRLTELRLPIDHDAAALTQAVADRLGVPVADVMDIHIFRRGHDARRRHRIVLVYTVDCAVRDEAAILAAHEGTRDIMAAPDTSYHFVVDDGPVMARRAVFVRPVVIGAGPCGLMAALVLAQMGLRPLVLERGKVVRERTVDTFALWRKSILNPESNVQFGEGGAGTFSDGKLYSQVSDPRHYGRKVLAEFVRAGAPEEILYLSRPHIGTFRLVSMVEHIRAEIEALGGEYRFGAHVTDFVVHDDGAAGRRIAALRLADGDEIAASHVVLAIGHSARDTFGSLHAAGVEMVAKPFSIGVRIEHPQSIINTARYGQPDTVPLLGAADYRLVHHAANGRGVYSFCMCPGGTVVAATSEAGQVVTNGMSQYSRAERNANAGIVVGVTPERDYPGGPLAGIAFQREWERRAFEAGGGAYFAPAQTVGDFLDGRPSTTLGDVVPSYKPGVTPTDLARCLPEFAVTAMREALPAFERKIAGFSMRDAVMTGVETRTSSPLRIPRGVDGQGVNVRGLFPAGEGAGYAGGILSAGIDGIRIAEAVALSLAGRPVEVAMQRGMTHATDAQ